MPTFFTSGKSIESMLAALQLVKDDSDSVKKFVVDYEQFIKTNLKRIETQLMRMMLTTNIEQKDCKLGLKWLSKFVPGSPFWLSQFQEIFDNNTFLYEPSDCKINDGFDSVDPKICRDVSIMEFIPEQKSWCTIL